MQKYFTLIIKVGHGKYTQYTIKENTVHTVLIRTCEKH